MLLPEVAFSMPVDLFFVYFVVFIFFFCIVFFNLITVCSTISPSTPIHITHHGKWH